MKKISFAVAMIAMFLTVYFCSHLAEKPARKISILTEPVSSVQIIPVVKEAVHINELAENYIRSVSQTFVVSPLHKTVVVGKKGLRVEVDPAALETINGNAVNDPVNVVIAEFTTTDELLKANAATMSNGKLLSSGGSYYVAMDCKGRQLRIKKNHSIKMEFPKTNDSDMELFYGERDAEGNMNWQTAGNPLVKSNTSRNSVYQPPFPDIKEVPAFCNRYLTYESTSHKVIFEERLTTIHDMAKLLQQRGTDKHLDTIRIPVLRTVYGARRSGNISYPVYYYDTILQYRVMADCELQEEKEWKAVKQQLYEKQKAANDDYAKEYWKNNGDTTVEAGLQQYYLPSSVSQLGWINCDRFYNSPMQEVPLEMPYTMRELPMQYFIVYTRINGLASGLKIPNPQSASSIGRLPMGEPVVFIAFVRKDGQILQCKTRFVIKPGLKLQPEFTEIDNAALKKMFGSNVVI